MIDEFLAIVIDEVLNSIRYEHETLNDRCEDEISSLALDLF